MAKKKGQDEAPNPSSVQNRDIMQRMNFLYQASVLLGTTNSDVPTPVLSKSAKSHPPPDRLLERQKRKQELLNERHPSTCADLSRSYVRSMKTIGQKTTVRMDPSVKRTLCKTCNVVLVPSCTATVRIHPSKSHGNVIAYTCMRCRTVRRIPAPPEPEPAPDPSNSAVNPLEDVADADSRMIVDAGSSTLAAVASLRPKKRPAPKVPPLFARKDAGHILFKGNERLPEQ